MANELTGDYDVVAQFTVAAVTRVMAGMHRGNRFPHSLSVRVDDAPQSKRSARSIVDTDGNALADRVQVGRTAGSGVRGIPPADDVITRNLDPVINDIRREVAIDVFSHLQGIAQLQLGAPSLHLPSGGGAVATARTPATIRYFPDPGSMPLPEFMRGEIVTTLGVQSLRSGAGAFVHVGLFPPAGDIHFSQFWPPQPLDPDQFAAINAALRNALLTSFQPSNAPLPAGVARIDFKSFPDEQAVAALMSSAEDAAPDPGSAPSVFLRAGDHFALAVSAGSVAGPFARAVNEAIDPARVQNLDTKVVIDYGIGTHTFHIFTTIRVLTATVEFEDGQIVLTIPVQVRFGWEDKPFFVPDPVNFDFTLRQAFTLSLNGANVGLVTAGTLSIDIPAGVPVQEAAEARKQAQATFNNAWNSRQAVIQQQINAALSVDGLHKFLSSLMNPRIAQKPDVAAQKRLVDIDPQLSYESFEIRRAGIVLHGSLALPPWPAANVEFELDPWTADTPRPEYSALNSWIPGGTIERYIWRYRGQAAPPDPNSFVSANAPPIGWSPNSVCVTVEGSRVSPSGPVVLERVSAGRCKGTTIPKAALNGFPASRLGELPNIALRRASLSHDPRPEVIAQASPWTAGGVENTANFLIHFPDRESAGHLDFLARALEQSERPDAVTAILCVLGPDQPEGVQAPDGLMFADDAQAWERLFDIGSRPATLLLSPGGEVAWRRHGALSGAELAGALNAHLESRAAFKPQLLESPLRIGQRAPNFLFETAPGRQLTLRKLAGRPVVLVFWRRSSKASLEMIRALDEASRRPGVDRPVILAVNDGETGDYAFPLTGPDGPGVVVAPDPDRSIAQAYGVAVWPTTVFVDAEGAVTAIHYGLIPQEQLLPPVGSQPPAYAEAGKEY